MTQMTSIRQFSAAFLVLFVLFLAVTPQPLKAEGCPPGSVIIYDPGFSCGWFQWGNEWFFQCSQDSHCEYVFYPISATGSAHVPDIGSKERVRPIPPPQSLPLFGPFVTGDDPNDDAAPVPARVPGLLP